MIHNFTQQDLKNQYNKIVDMVIKNDIKPLLDILEKDPDLILQNTNFSFHYPTETDLSDNNTFIIPNNELPLIHIAAFFDNLDVFSLLHQRGVSLRKVTTSNFYPLHYACAGGANEVTAYILSKDPIQLQEDEKPEHHYVNLAICSKSPHVLQMLFDYGLSLDSEPLKNSSPLENALKSRSFDCLNILLKYKCSSSVETLNTPLMYAILHDMTEAVGPLLDRGADPYVITSQGYTALTCAIQLGAVDVVKLLCQRMVSINPSTEKERNPVELAILSKNTNILRIILEKFDDVNKPSKHDRLISYCLTWLNDFKLASEMLQLLIDHGLDINFTSYRTQRLLEYIIMNPVPTNCFQLAEELLVNGADPFLPMGNQYENLINYVKSIKGSKDSKSIKAYALFKRFYPDEFD